jgi:hypothetical protein
MQLLKRTILFASSNCKVQVENFVLQIVNKSIAFCKALGLVSVFKRPPKLFPIRSQLNPTNALIFDIFKINFLFGLFFDSEDRCAMLFRNIV